MPTLRDTIAKRDGGLAPTLWRLFSVTPTVPYHASWPRAKRRCWVAGFTGQIEGQSLTVGGGEARCGSQPASRRQCHITKADRGRSERAARQTFGLPLAKRGGRRMAALRAAWVSGLFPRCILLADCWAYWLAKLA